MSTDVLRQHQLFWIYVQSDGRCSVCGEKVNPDEATVTGTVLHAISDASNLDQAKLTHIGCREDAVPSRRTLRAA